MVEEGTTVFRSLQDLLESGWCNYLQVQICVLDESAAHVHPPHFRALAETWKAGQAGLGC